MSVERGIRFPPMLCCLLALATACRTPVTTSVGELTSSRSRIQVLPSGLRVVIDEDDTASVVTLIWIVDTGYIDDPPGQDGISHALEHLTFRARNAKSPPVWDQLRAMGARPNASTGLETTTYEAFVPRPLLDQIVRLELDRMAEPLHGIDAAALVAESRILAQEYRVRTATPAAAAEVALAALMGSDHPHARGFAAMQAPPAVLTLGEVRNFAARQYRPELMTLVVAGPVTPDWDQRLWQMMPPSLMGASDARTKPIRHAVATSQAELAPARPDIPTREASVLDHELWISWSLPNVTGKAVVPYSVLSRMIDAAFREATRKGRLAGVTSTSVGLWPGALANALLCRLVLGQGVNPQGVREVATSLVQQQAIEMINRPDHGTVKEAVLRTALAMENPIRRARIHAHLAHRDPGAGLADLYAAVQGVSRFGLSHLAEEHLRAQSARAVLLVPAARGINGPPPPSANDHFGLLSDSQPGSALPSAESFGASAEGDPSVADDPVAEQRGDTTTILNVARPPGVTAAVTAKLSNGLTVIALRRAAAPFVTMVLGFHADPSPAELPGLRIAATFGRTHSHLAVPPIDRGVLQAIHTDHDSYWETLSLLSPSVPKALELIADEAAVPSLEWPNKSLDQSAERLSTLASTPDAQAERTFRSVLWGDHIYGASFPELNVVRNLSREDVEKWLARVRRPENGVLTMVGDFEPRQVLVLAEQRLKSWRGSSPALVASSAPGLPARAAIVTPPPPPKILSSTSSQARATLLRFGCFLSPARGKRDAVIHTLITELARESLLKHLRVERGVSYAQDVRVTHLRGGTSVFLGIVDLSPGTTDVGIELVKQSILGDALAANPAAIEAARWRLARRSGMAYQDNASLARLLFDSWNLEWPLDAVDDLPQHLKTITADEIRNALAPCASSAVISTLAPKP